MATIGPSLPTLGNVNATEDPIIRTFLSTLLTEFNGNIDSANMKAAGISNLADKLATAEGERLGISSSGTVRRGKTNIATSESRTNVAYGTLTTPDQVTGLVLPTDGLIAVWYQATWQESVASAAKAAVFIGANQLTFANTTSASPTGQECAHTQGAFDKPLYSYPLGLRGEAPNTTVYTGPTTTGQIVGGFNPGVLEAGGPAWVFAAAGTYTVSVQFKASSGSVTAKNRKLWVWTLGF